VAHRQGLPPPPCPIPPHTFPNRKAVHPASLQQTPTSSPSSLQCPCPCPHRRRTLECKAPPPPPPINHPFSVPINYPYVHPFQLISPLSASPSSRATWTPRVRACAGRRLPFILFSFHFVFVSFCFRFICFSLHFVFVSFVFRFILFSFHFVFVSFCFRFIFVYRMFSLLCFPVLNFFFQLFYRPTGPHGGHDARGELRQI
jgi:hypothetical protein